MLSASLFVAWMAFADGAGSPSVFLGYFCNWHQWREGGFEFTVDNIQGDMITHVNFAFAMIGSSTYSGGAYHIRHFEDNDIASWGAGPAYEKLNTDIKKKYPHLKTLISVGGWSFDSPEEEDPKSAERMKRLDPGWTNTIFSDMSSTKENREKFIESCLAFCKEYGFDGIDLDWEYPGATDRGGKTEDKENFVLLLKEMREAITAQENNLLFTIAAGVGPTRVEEGYNIPELNKYLDFVNLMTYDLYGGWDTKTGTCIHSQLHNFDTEELSGAWAVDHWIEKGMSPKKLTLGWATYSRSFKLKTSDPGQGIGVEVTGFGDKQPFSQQEGTATYYEMVELLQDPNAKTTHDSKRCAAYLQKGDLWMGYDDVQSMACKAKFIKDKGLLGGFMWALPEDDFKKGSPLTAAFSKAICLPAVVCASDEGGGDITEGGSGGTATVSTTKTPRPVTPITETTPRPVTAPATSTQDPTQRPVTPTGPSTGTTKDVTPKPPSTKDGENCKAVKNSNMCAIWATQGLCEGPLYATIKLPCEAYCNCFMGGDGTSRSMETQTQENGSTTIAIIVGVSVAAVIIAVASTFLYKYIMSTPKKDSEKELKE